MSNEKDYVLGTHDAELERLGLQHRVWLPRASAAWRRAGFTAGQTLVDVGCGPGYASLDLAGIVGGAGRVIAIDRSRRFLDALADGARRRGVSAIEAHELDLDEAPLPVANADGAWSRWVYAFVRRPRPLLEKVVAALRPGGTLVMHEYVDYRGWRLSPRSEVFESFVTAVMASWRAEGGEPDIGLDLPRWLAELDVEVLERNMITEAVTPGDFVWQWPKAFVGTGARRLAELGRMSAADADAVGRAFDAAERTPGAFVVTPPVIEVIARKR